MIPKNIYKFIYKNRVEIFAALLLLIYFIQSVYIILNIGMIGDEQFYPGVGKYLIETKDFGPGSPFVLRSHPVLSYYINSIFLIFDKNPVWSHKPFDMSANAQAYGLDNLLFLTRLPIALTGVLLGFFIFRWSRKLYGNKAALIALILFSFEPTILGNSSIVTSDLVATTFIFIAVYYFWCLLKNSSKSSLIIAGFALGLALLSKFTALLLIPITLVLFFYFGKISLKTAKRAVIYYIIAFLVIWAFYGFQFDSMINVVHSNEKATDFINQTFHSEGMKSLVTNLMNVPVPVPAYLNAALGYNIWHSTEGHISFLMGETSVHGWWYFYIIAYLIKTPISILLFLFMFTIFLASKKIKMKKDWLFIVLPIIATFIFLSFFIGFDIGLRHLMIAYPFIFVILSSIVTANLKKHQKRILNLFIIALLIWYVFEAVTFLPYNMSYFNQFIGKPENGYLWLSDANIDIGQGINEVGKYAKQHNLTSLYISTPIPKSFWNYYGNFSYASCQPANGIYAISIDMLNMIRRDCYSWLRERTPDAILGYSTFVYNVTDINI
ncbi:MAG: glycosyltransferase family 39 protein [Candidatus Aenigmarchaeota archaeon]|nr:glycosyltransferase family 39 protein [Candidatus Aenigmarchaeota archaeon]